MSLVRRLVSQGFNRGPLSAGFRTGRWTLAADDGEQDKGISKNELDGMFEKSDQDRDEDPELPKPLEPDEMAPDAKENSPKPMSKEEVQRMREFASGGTADDEALDKPET